MQIFLDDSAGKRKLSDLIREAGAGVLLQVSLDRSNQGAPLSTGIK